MMITSATASCSKVKSEVSWHMQSMAYGSAKLKSYRFFQRRLLCEEKE